MILDTHKEVENLISAGLEKKVAEAIINVQAKREDELATKQDLKILEVSLKTELSWIKGMLFAVLGLLLAPMAAQIMALYIK